MSSLAVMPFVTSEGRTRNNSITGRSLHSITRQTFSLEPATFRALGVRYICQIYHVDIHTMLLVILVLIQRYTQRVHRAKTHTM